MTAEIPPLTTLGERVSWLIEQAHTAEQEPMSDYEVARLVSKEIGRQVGHNAIWKLRTGRTANPSWELIDGLARVFGVPVGWFSAGRDDAEAASVTEQIALLAELRRLGFRAYHFNAMRNVGPEVRSAIITMIEMAARDLEGGTGDSGHSRVAPAQSDADAIPGPPNAER
jgi:transcriptional regulator with XRE-family HTH domain